MLQRLSNYQSQRENSERPLSYWLTLVTVQWAYTYTNTNISIMYFHIHNTYVCKYQYIIGRL